MASYKGVVIAPSLTKTAGGKNMYVPLSRDASGDSVIEGDVTIAGKLTVLDDEVVESNLTVLQTDLTTAQSSATLDLSGGVGQNGPAGSSIYRFSKVCGPSAGAQYQDHLHLFRLGPTGAINPIVSGVLNIAPKMVADSSPAENLMDVYADLFVGGALLPNSFRASNPTGFGGAGQWTIVLSGMRFVFQRVETNPQGDPNPGLFAVTTPQTYWAGGSAVAGEIFGLATALTSQIGGGAYAPRMSNGGRVSGSNIIVDGFLGDGAGTAEGGIAVFVMIVGPAA